MIFLISEASRRRYQLSKGSSGFTLVEVMVAVTIFSILATAVYASLSIGIQSWRRGEYYQRAYQDARLLLDALAYDLRNATELEGMPFEGEAQALRFVIRKDDRQLEKHMVPFERVRYVYQNDTKGQRVMRASTMGPAKNDAGELMPILNHVAEFKLSFFGYESSKDSEDFENPENPENNAAPQWMWHDSWMSEGELPRGVRVVLMIRDDKTKEKAILIDQKIRLYTGSGKIMPPSEEDESEKDV